MSPENEGKAQASHAVLERPTRPSTTSPARMAFRCSAELPFSRLTVAGDFPLKEVESSTGSIAYAAIGRLSIQAASPNGSPIQLRHGSIPVNIRALASPDLQHIGVVPVGTIIDGVDAEIASLERKRSEGRLSEAQYRERRLRILNEMNAHSRLTDLYALQSVSVTLNGTTVGGSILLRLTDEDYGVGLDFALTCNVTRWPFPSPTSTQ